MSDLHTPELDRLLNIAEDIAILKPIIRRSNGENEPLLNTDYNFAIDCLKAYSAEFGSEGLDYIENKFEEYYKNDGVNGAESYKYGGRTPNNNNTDKADIKIIEKLIDDIETPKLLRHENREDKKAHYKEFVEQEKKEISAFTAESQKQVKTPTYHLNLPHIPMKHKNGGIQAGLLQIKEEMIKNGETPPLERRNINSKEKNMSNERQEDSEYAAYMASLNTTEPLVEEKKELSPKEKAFRDAVITAGHQRKVIADALKAGTLACLPGKDGYADTTPAVNIMTPHKPYHGEFQLFLKAFQKQEQNDFPTAEFVTYHQIDKARADGIEVYPRKGVHGESLIISEQKDTGEWENKKITLFNIAQTNNPEALKKWAEKKIAEQEQKDLEYNQTRYGSGWKPPEKKAKEPGPEIVCSSTEPEKYLGQYLAAISMGSKFKVTPEQAAEFSEKMVSALYKPMEPIMKENGEIKKPPLNKETGQPITDTFSLEKISRRANEECKDFLRDLHMQTQKQNQPEQKQEQTQSIGRGR